MGVTGRECISELLPPQTRTGAIAVAKSLLFPDATDLSDEDHAKLAEAYELACDELVGELGYSSEQLSEAIEPMAVALLALYRAGQHDKVLLGRYASFQAIKAKAEHKD